MCSTPSIEFLLYHIFCKSSSVRKKPCLNLWCAKNMGYPRTFVTKNPFEGDLFVPLLPPYLVEVVSTSTCSYLHAITTSTFFKHLTKDDNTRITFYCMSNTTLKGIEGSEGCFTYRCIVDVCEVSDRCKSGDVSVIG